jgi:hypothetical protein
LAYSFHNQIKTSSNSTALSPFTDFIPYCINLRKNSGVLGLFRMSEMQLAWICQLVNHGAKIYIGSDYMGNRKIKVVRGPFGLLTKRFSCNDGDVDRLRRKLAQRNFTAQ